MNVLILSGGMDSSVLAHQLKGMGEDVHCLSFYYGQKHSRELGYAEETAFDLGFAHETVELDSLQRLLSSSLTNPERSIPQGHYAQSNMIQTVVPNRNMIMLAIASGYASSIGAECVWTAVHAGDHAIYPDCRPTFITSLNVTLGLALEGLSPVSVVAPYIHLSKTGIAHIGKQLGVDWSTTYSCYEGGPKHCGKCGTCVERQEALHEADCTDTTEYLDSEFWKKAVSHGA